MVVHQRRLTLRKTTWSSTKDDFTGLSQKPRGRPPLNTSGESAEWDEETGTWLDVQEKKKPTKIKSIRSSTIRSSLLLITEAIDEFTQCQAEYTEQHATQMRKMIKGLNNVIDKIND